MTETQRFATFYLERHLFGIEVTRIQEVLGRQQITPAPLAPPVVVGLINLRGQIVTAIDLRTCFGLKDRPPTQPAMNIVVRGKGDDLLSLLVDEVGEVVEVGEETFEPPPQTMDSESRLLIHGVHKLPDGLMHVLNCEHVVHARSQAEIGLNNAQINVSAAVMGKEAPTEGEEMA